MQSAANRNFSNAVWLLFLDEDIEIEELFKDINIPFDCEFLVVQSLGKKMVVIETYRIAPSLVLLNHTFAVWTKYGIHKTPNDDLFKRRRNLNGLVLKTAVISVSKFYTMFQNKDEVEIIQDV